MDELEQELINELSNETRDLPEDSIELLKKEAVETVKPEKKPSSSSIVLIIRNYLYAGITAGVTALASYIGARFGFDISQTDQIMIAGGVMTALWGGFEYLYKRYGKGFVV